MPSRRHGQDGWLIKKRDRNEPRHLRESNASPDERMRTNWAAWLADTVSGPTAAATLVREPLKTRFSSIRPKFADESATELKETRSPWRRLGKHETPSTALPIPLPDLCMAPGLPALRRASGRCANPHHPLGLQFRISRALLRIGRSPSGWRHFRHVRCGL
jgi:hypothetical protein